MDEVHAETVEQAAWKLPPLRPGQKSAMGSVVRSAEGVFPPNLQRRIRSLRLNVDAVA